MVWHGGQALYLRATQPGLQPLDQSGQSFALAGVAGKQLAAGWLAGAQVITAHTELKRRCSQRPSAQTLGQQAEQMPSISCRLSRCDLQRGLPRAVFAARATAAPGLVVQHQREARDAGLPRSSPGQQSDQQQLRASQHLRTGIGTAQQLDPVGKTLRQGQPGLGLGRQASGAVDLGQQPGAETPGQAGARQVANARTAIMQGYGANKGSALATILQRGMP